MKHVALTLLAATCGALSASALDASNARIWLNEKIQPDFAAVAGSGIASDKLGTTPTFARTWQYVSIPLHVEGVAKGDAQPHFIPELKVRISLAVSTTDEKGKPTDSPELLSKEITYVDVPLVKGKKANMGESIVNVGVFVSPSNAFKLSAKDGNLAKKIIAVAVEGEFKGSDCNRIKEKPNDGVATAVVLNAKEGRNLSDGWWKKKGGSGDVQLAAISETPFAADYARMGFPPVKPLYGAASATPSAAPAAPVAGTASTTTSSSDGSSTSSSSSSSSTSGGPTYPTPSSTSDSSSADDDSSATEDEGKSKKGKKSKRNRR